MTSPKRAHKSKRIAELSSRKDHWQRVYDTSPIKELGWYDPEMKLAMDWIHSLNLAPDARIIDVGGGSSELVDLLIQSGFEDLTVLDVSDHALNKARKRLGVESGKVTWKTANILSANLPTQQFDLWHDRAMFHFLMADDEIHNYLHTLSSSLKNGGHVILGVFSPEAPSKCSGLPVKRYSIDQMLETLGRGYILEQSKNKLHLTPSGIEQMYLFCLFRKCA